MKERQSKLSRLSGGPRRDKMIKALDAEALERITNNATETKKTNHGSKG